jgi:hypothetical protein
MFNLDLDTMADLDIYHAFVENGKEAEALTGSYPELIELIGIESVLKLFKHFRGCKIDCPKFFYRQDYAVNLAAQETEKRERAKIAIATGYTANRIEVLVARKRQADMPPEKNRQGDN